MTLSTSSLSQESSNGKLLALSFSAHAGCDHIRQRAEAKMSDIEKKIRSLQKHPTLARQNPGALALMVFVAGLKTGHSFRKAE